MHGVPVWVLPDNTCRKVSKLFAMDRLPPELYTPEQVRELDRIAIEEAGIPGETLMERAGRRLWESLRRRWPGARRIAVLCGGGNNGGDGYVVGRLARRGGLHVDLLYLTEPARLSGAAAAHAGRFQEAGGTPRPWGAGAAPLLAEADVIVDAMLGTGLDRPVAGRFAEAVEAVNGAARPVAAVDIPSGIHGRTGAELGVAVRASLSVTFIGLKSGLVTGRGAACRGELIFDDLETAPPSPGRMDPYARLETPADLAAALPPRSADAHKGDCGHVLVVGGERGMAGAARLCGEAAARAGAGLVTVATRAEHAAVLNATRPELMVHGVEDAEALTPLLARTDVVALGPGLGQLEWGRALWRAVLAWDGPKILDADALNLLAAEPRPVDGAVITPHPGEAARLLGESGAAVVREDRFAAARRLAECYNVVAVLKGAGTVVDDGVRRWVVAAGNPGMASGGMGDALTGVVAALIGQGVAPEEAARAGALAHGVAGDRAAARIGRRGLLCGDLIGELPGVVSGR